jgi:hypothetical protein
VFTGCLNNESFLSNIKKGIQCCHVYADLYYKDGALFIGKWDPELNDWSLTPLTAKYVELDNEALSRVLDYLAKEGVLKIAVE